VTPHGHTYTCKGTRKSGTPDTAVGNTLLNVLMDVYGLYLHTDCDWWLMATGDDCWACTDADISVDKLEVLSGKLIETSKRLGFKLEPKFSKDIARTEYCSSMLVPVTLPGDIRSFVLARLPGKVIATGLSRRPYNGPITLRQWGAVVCDAHQNSPFPFVGDFFRLAADYLALPSVDDPSGLRETMLSRKFITTA